MLLLAGSAEYFGSSRRPPPPSELLSGLDRGRQFYERAEHSSHKFFLNEYKTLHRP